MQSTTLDRLLRVPEIVGSETLMDANSLQTEVEPSSTGPSPEKEGNNQYDDSFTDVDCTTEIDNYDDKIRYDDDVLPSILQKKPINSVNLGSILNGNRKSKILEPIETTPMVGAVPIPTTRSEIIPTAGSEIIVPELDSITKSNTIEELEKKMFKRDNKSVNIKDFLGAKKPPPEVINLISEPDIEEIPPDSQLLNGKKVITDEELGEKTGLMLVTLNVNKKLSSSMNDNITNWESKIFQNQKKASAKDLLGKPKNSFKVTLKVDKEALSFFKKFENPLYSSSNTKFIRTPKLPITLKIGTEHAKSIDIKLNKKVKKPKGSIFDIMMKNAVSDAVKLTPLQKLKELEPPTIKKNQFHVYNDDMEYRLLTLNPRLSKYSYEILESFEFPITSDPNTTHFMIETVPKPMTKQEINEQFINRCNILDPIFKHLYDMLELPNDELILWPSLFEPLTTDSLLLLDYNKRHLKNWMFNSFNKLKNQSFKASRKLKNTKPKRRDEFADFLADDDELYQPPPDIFMPILIIHGSTGIGKSASVYTVMKELKGYVYEINASQSRSRRDLLSTLKELCTTHLIHKQDEEGEFQKGIVLLEDCDILFEQDRTFWTVVLEILEISRRPIVLTCTDPDVIPKSIYEYAVENDAILNFDFNRPSDKNIYKDYLWGCGLTQGFYLNNDVLELILNNDKFDLRQLLLTCQYYCQTNENSMVELKIKSTIETNSIKDLQLRLEALDLLSLSDNIGTNSYSQINHSEIPNEFIDINYIDDTKQLKQSPTSSELLINDYIYQQGKLLYNDDYFKDLNKPFRNRNEIRSTVNNFIASRSKPMPALLKGLNFSRDRVTRSNIDIDSLDFWSLEQVGTPDNSITINASPNAYLTELCPYARYWNGLQIALDNAVKNDKESGKNIKSFLQWREFQDRSNRTFKTLPTAKYLH